LQAYRAIEHGDARRRFNSDAIDRFPNEAKRFGDIFVSMQDHRHLADYDPTEDFVRREVVQLIEEAQGAISDFDRVSLTDRRALAIYMLLRIRQ